MAIPAIGFFFYAYLNSFYEKGFSNPIDEAIRSYREQDVSGYEKVDEVPYDFIRKRLSIMIKKDGRYFMVTKGPSRMCSLSVLLPKTRSGIR